MKRVFILVAILLTCAIINCEYVGFMDLRKTDSTNSSCTSDCCRGLHPRTAMTYYFYQNTGRFKGGQGQFSIDTKSYSGKDKGYLNPDMQCKNNIGPLPATTYKLASCVSHMHQSSDRPCSFYLHPDKQSEVCGRFSLYIHGCECCTPSDDLVPPVPGCSNGSIIMNYANRRKLRLGDTLIVIHYEPTGEQSQTSQQSTEQRIEMIME